MLFNSAFVSSLLFWVFINSPQISLCQVGVDTKQSNNVDPINNRTENCPELTINKLWSTAVSHSSFAAEPLVVDLRGKGRPDVIATSYAEDLVLVNPETGRIHHHGAWPLHLHGVTTHSAPLLYDHDRDGLLDVLVISTDGQFIFVNGNGKILYKEHPIPPLYVKKSWFEKTVTVDLANVEQFVTTTPDDAADYVKLHSHVLATPVIDDIKGNGLHTILLPVTYYTDAEHESAPLAPGINATRYVCGAVVAIDLMELFVLWTRPLGLSRRDSEFPQYMLSSPTLVDLDGGERGAGELEVLVTSGGGQLVALNYRGDVLQAYRGSRDSFYTAAQVADLDASGDLEVVVVDASGNVAVLTSALAVKWEAETEPCPSPALILLDISGDGRLDIVVAANSGKIYGLDGGSGESIEGWRRRATGPSVSATLTTLQLPHSAGRLALVSVTDEGYLHVFHGAGYTCHDQLYVEETTLAPLLSADTHPGLPGKELLISSRDGSLLSLSFFNGSGAEEGEREMLSMVHMLEGSGDLGASHNYHARGQQVGLMVWRQGGGDQEMTGSTFDLTLTFLNPHHTARDSYTVQVWLGSVAEHKTVLSEPGRHRITLATPASPAHTHVTVTLRNRHGQVFSQVMTLRFNQSFLHDLQWLLYGPFVLLVASLILTHTLNLSPLLPTSNQHRDT